MSVIQSKIDEIRYIKRQNLEEEAKIVGNYYRDILRQFGVDCNYYKLKIPYLELFKTTIDENTLILHAYGQDNKPDYTISSDMITYMEVENDVFQLNKYGIIPNMDVNFYFDSKDFACALAYKLGQLKEYKIKETKFSIEVPESVSDYVEYDADGDGVNERYYLSDDLFPYGIGYDIPQFFESDILSGKFAVAIEPYEVGKEYTVMCHPYEHGDVAVRFPVNDTIYKSFEHVIDTKEFVDTMLFLTYKVRKVKTAGSYRFVLDGRLHGAVLFHDLNKVGKYLEMIHPDVGDIVTIDFPDPNNRQQFEITDCFDKQLTNDGINPLLHKYVWKCKARRYINSGEDFPEKNEANERWDEKMDFLDNSDEIVTKKIAKYDEYNNDAVYGGYERETESHDKRKVDPEKNPEKRSHYTFIDDGSYINLLTFYDGSKLVTDGYELYYIDSKNECYRLTLVDDKDIIKVNLVNTGIQYLKATDNALFFVNFDNNIQRLCDDEEFTEGEIEYCLNSLVDTTYDDRDNNRDGNHYYKFRESNTVLMSVDDHLYCRFGNSKHKMVKLV